MHIYIYICICICQRKYYLLGAVPRAAPCSHDPEGARSFHRDLSAAIFPLQRRGAHATSAARMPTFLRDAPRPPS